MAVPPPLVFDLIGIVFTSILYDFYCLIFGLYWRIQVSRADRWKGVLLYAITLNFILCTAYFIIAIIQVQFDITMALLNKASLVFTGEWMTITTNALYTSIDSISQMILLYRCWIMWRQPLVMVIPCILSLAFLATSSLTLFIQMKALPVLFVRLSYSATSAVAAYFSLSLGVNTLVTALIVYRIIIVTNGVRGFSTGKVQATAHGQRDLYPLISILIESGLMTFVGQLAQLIIFKFADAAFPLIRDPVVMLYGISTTVVLVRVEMGVSYDHYKSGQRTQGIRGASATLPHSH